LLNNRRSFFLRGKWVLIALFFLSLAQGVFAFGGKERAEAPVIIQVTGLVRLVGSATFPELIISDPENTENTWVVAREERAKLNDLQYRTVTVEGEETVTEMTFANGTPAGIRRELRNIRIIAVH
jgi:hypothetical protein